MTNGPGKPLGTKGVITAIGIIVTAAVGIVTAVHGWWQSKREFELQERQQLQQLRMAYMNVMVDGGFERVEIVADFIAETEQDETIKIWAAAQKKKAAETAAKLRTQAEDERKALAEAEEKRVAAEQHAKTAEAEAQRLAQQAAANQSKKEEAETAAKVADEAKGNLANAKADTRIREVKLNHLTETLRGRERGEMFEQTQRPRVTAP